jgi:response regulator of citrate/malate metabolism
MIRTLIVEDDPMVMQINERFLNKVKGFEHVGSANDLDRAKEMVLDLKPELVLLDIFFSIGRGVDIIQWLREKNLDVDVIFITADRNPKTIERAFRFGAVDYLVKPFQFERFEEALTKYRRQRRLIEGSESMEQSAIDSMSMGCKTARIISEEPKEVIDERNQTHLDILNLLMSNASSGYTAQEVADELGISRITARRYLDEMECENKLELYLEYGKVGRPRNKYRINVSRQEDDLQ